MTTLGLSLSPRESSRYAVLDGATDTGFVIVKLYKSRPTWQIRHELGDVVTEMIGREIEVEHEDLGQAFEALEALLHLERTADVTVMRFKPVPATPRRPVTLVG